ncbi:MAG TPA: SDR family oxidoreductase [Acidimicrobiales bacterium]|nr:SDR family oxidoreductase [Acidimicrobiales bacterium]
MTGAGRGMGRSCADALADTVDALVLVDRDPDLLTTARDQLAATDATVTAFVADVTDRTRLEQLAGLVAELGALTSVAHAAGISPTMAAWPQIFAVDLVGSALVLDVLTPLVTTGTAAVCFASMAAQIVVPHGDPRIDAVLDDPLHTDLSSRLADAIGETIADTAVAYGWAKRGVQRLVRREALRWGRVGGRVCSVSPGIIDTPQGAQEAAAQPAMTALVDLSPVRRFGRPEEVADVVAFLLSHKASFITGTDVLIDGGVCAALGLD